jgi:penicillin amidase
LARFLLITCSVFVLLLAGGYYLLQRSLPRLDGIVSLSHLARSASVKYDDRQIPYIDASCDLDAYRVQGYVTAQDRLFQMDVARRSALGLLSEVMGSQSLPHDKLVRTVGLNRVVAQELKQLPQEYVKVLEAYSQGVNSFVEKNQDRLPIEFVLLGYSPSQWTPLDSLAILKYKQYELDESWRLDDLRQRVLDKSGAPFASYLFNRQFAAAPAVSKLPAQPFWQKILPSFRPSYLNIGSNGYALGKRVTDTGGAILALDRHNELTCPADFYLLSLRAPQLHVAGATIVGVPGVAAGRNDSIGFAGTSMKVDTQDLFLEEFSPQFQNKYKTPQGWSNAVEILEEIPVRFSQNLFQSSKLVHKVICTRHGPILVKNADSAVALSWSGLTLPEKSSGLFELLIKLNKTEKWQDFENHLTAYKGSPSTFLYVDKEGNLGMQEAGAVPVRKSANRFGQYEGLLLNLGWTGYGDWSGLLSMKELGSSYNPSSNYVIANLPSTSGLPLNVNFYRSGRIAQVLASCVQRSSQQKAGLPEMAVLQGDQQAALGELVKSSILEAVGKSELIDQFQIKALETLSKWDGNLSADSQAAAIYESFLRTVMRRILEPRLDVRLTNEYLDCYPQWSTVAQRFFQEKKVEWLPAEERTFKNFVITSFVHSLKDLRVASSDNANNKLKRWGNLHNLTISCVLAKGAPGFAQITRPINLIRQTGLGGDADSPCANEVLMTRGPDSFSCTHGPTMRLLIDMSDSQKFYQNLYLGQSGHYFSPSSFDQLPSWLSGKPLPLAFSPDAEGKICQHRLLFSAQ